MAGNLLTQCYSSIIHSLAALLSRTRAAYFFLEYKRILFGNSPGDTTLGQPKENVNCPDNRIHTAYEDYGFSGPIHTSETGSQQNA